MINDLLDISKMESGTLTLELGQVDLRHTVEEAANTVKGLAREKELELVVEVEVELPEIEADPDKLRRTVVNLLGNAVKFTPSGGRVSVGAKNVPDRDAVLLYTSDTGEGIPEEYREKIFEKFGQVETRKSGRKMSTGLGLTFCKMVAEAHGGRIWVESEPGKGSTFYVELPVARA